MQTANEWTKNRLCAVCGGSFNLEAHGSAEAKSAAEFLQQGILNAAELPPLIARCPSCLDTGKLSEREAVAAVRDMGVDMEVDDTQQTLRYVRQVGVLVALVSATGLLLAFAYARLRQGEYDPTFFYVLFAVTTSAGISAGVYAVIRLRELESGAKGQRKL